jgi:hypothetical protein
MGCDNNEQGMSDRNPIFRRLQLCKHLRICSRKKRNGTHGKSRRPLEIEEESAFR